MKGIITTIQRMSIHDGPGIRSTVFFKGCNFRCSWCHNPETRSTKAQLQYIEGLCTRCGKCIDACPNNAILFEDSRISINRHLCINCGECVSVCPSKAICMTGRVVDSQDLVDELLQDRPFFDESNGGITISGGEPFLQFAFMLELLKNCKRFNIHTAIETNLSCSGDKVKKLIPYVDLWMVDLKTLTDSIHVSHTGVSNINTIANIEFLSGQSVDLMVRTPIIPGVNDDSREIEAICKRLSELNVKRYELLQFHTLGFDKFRQYGMANPMSDISMLGCSDFESLQAILRAYKLNLK